VAIGFGVVCWKLGKLVWNESFEFIGSNMLFYKF
jgi:hypothetical protein